MTRESLLHQADGSAGIRAIWTPHGRMWSLCWRDRRSAIRRDHAPAKRPHTRPRREPTPRRLQRADRWHARQRPTEAKRRHVLVHRFVLARLDDVGLVPDADRAVEAERRGPAPPRRYVLPLFGVGVALQVVE